MSRERKEALQAICYTAALILTLITTNVVVAFL